MLMAISAFGFHYPFQFQAQNIQENAAIGGKTV
jgi:hypothetical protein